MPNSRCCATNLTRRPGISRNCTHKGAPELSDTQMSETQMSETQRPWFHWQTSIAWKNKDRIVIRGYDVNELTGNIDFGEMLHLVLRGELPSEPVAKLTNALMVNLAEHAMSPSSATVRFATSG